MNYREKFQVTHNCDLKLDKVDPEFKNKHENKESAEAEIAENVEKMRDLQYLLYAEGKHSLLVCLQALDAAGKDGTINHVLGAMNPQGCKVYGFKAPSKEELAHDFLWRVHARTPARGEVGIFNRSGTRLATVELATLLPGGRGDKAHCWTFVEQRRHDKKRQAAHNKLCNSGRPGRGLLLPQPQNFAGEQTDGVDTER